MDRVVMDRVAGSGGRAALVRWVSTAPRTPAAVGVLLGLAAVGQSLVGTAGTDVDGAFTLVVCVLALATTLPLSLLRPAAAAAAITAASALSLMPFHALTVAGAAGLLLALFRLGLLGPQLLAACCGLPFLLLALIPPVDDGTRILTVVLAVFAPSAAWAGAARRTRLDADAQRAAGRVIAGTLLEHTARGERARIARELHDVVAHHISMISVQAEAARLTTAGMPPAGAQRLLEIGRTARSALTEMRRLLGVLRADADSEVAERTPQPGLRQLNDLLDEARDVSRSGTRLILRGRPGELDPGVELAAYRIVQEALSNVRRHAPGSAVDVELLFADDTLRIRVRDNGPGPLTTEPPGGHGLLGMRERAAAVGGRLVTGPAVGGGFLVETVLPVNRQPR